MAETPQHSKAITPQFKNSLKVWNIKVLQNYVNLMIFESNLKTGKKCLHFKIGLWACSVVYEIS